MEKFRLLIPEGTKNKTNPAGVGMLGTVIPGNPRKLMRMGIFFLRDIVGSAECDKIY